MPAKISRLGKLHELLTESLIYQLENLPKDENGNTLPPHPQLLAQVIRFLDTQGIQADEDNPRLQRLKAAFSDNVRQFPFDPAREGAAETR